MSKMQTKSSRPPNARNRPSSCCNCQYFPSIAIINTNEAGSNEVFFPDSCPTSTEIHPLLHRIATRPSFDNDTHVGVRSGPRWYVTRPDQSTIWHHPLPIASSDGFPRCEYTNRDGISNMKIRRPDLRNCSLVMRFPTHLCDHLPQCRMRCRRRRIYRRHSPH